MTVNETRAKLVQLKLFGMAEGVDSQLATGRCEDLSFEDRLGMLVDHEITFRENRRLKTLLRLAKLKMRADLNDIQYAADRNISRTLIANLATCSWISRGINVLITGATGTGKTFLACALGHQACLRGNAVQFHRLGLLLGDLEQARIDGTLRKRLAFFNRCALLILDDFGIKARLTTSECELLLDLIDGRSGTGATIRDQSASPDHLARIPQCELSHYRRCHHGPAADKCDEMRTTGKIAPSASGHPRRLTSSSMRHFTRPGVRTGYRRPGA